MVEYKISLTIPILNKDVRRSKSEGVCVHLQRNNISILRLTNELHKNTKIGQRALSVGNSHGPIHTSI
jgi:hypothetical protein